MAIASFSRATGVLLLALFATGAAHAIYRCGKVYQDRPCDDESAQTLLVPGAPAPKPAATTKQQAATKAATPASDSTGVSCSDLREELTSVNADLRRGANAAGVEQLQSRRSAVEKSLRENRC
jgi:hypothetical protein